jgi:hypothetical protein
MPEYKLRDKLERLLITSAGTRAVVFAADAEGAIGTTALAELHRRHLIRTERRSEGTWLELAHDRLIGPMRSSDEAVRAARRSARLRLRLAAAGVVIAVAAGIFLAVLVSAKTANQTLHSQLASLKVVTFEQKQTAHRTETTKQVAIDWVNDFNLGDDRAAAGLMAPVVAIVTNKLTKRPGTSTTILLPLSLRHERARAYLSRQFCSLGRTPTLGTVTADTAQWVVQAVNPRGSHPCAPGPQWLLTLTVRGSKVVAVEHTILASGSKGKVRTTSRRASQLASGLTAGTAAAGPAAAGAAAAGPASQTATVVHTRGSGTRSGATGVVPSGPGSGHQAPGTQPTPGSQASGTPQSGTTTATDSSTASTPNSAVPTSTSTAASTASSGSATTPAPSTTTASAPSTTFTIVTPTTSAGAGG